MRDLAKVVTVETKNKMYQKDKICYVTFKEIGYEAIVPITTNIGDKMIFIGEGSLLPEEPKWEFLRKRCYIESEKAFLIRPMTMGAKDINGEKGERVKSWGLCVTLADAGLPDSIKSGADVTNKLNIRKCESDEEASPTKKTKVPGIIKFFMKHRLTRWLGNLWFNAHKKVSGNFPTEIIAKSDETTIQNCKNVISEFEGKKAYITAKIEGQSMTASLDPKHKYKLYVCSRNNRFDSVDSVSAAFFNTAKLYDIETKLKEYLKKTGVLLMLQGERCGEGCQNNIYNFTQDKLFLYRMKGLENGNWVEYAYPKMKAIADELGFDCVPLIEVVDDMASKFNVMRQTAIYTDGKLESTMYNTAEVINNLVAYAENVFWRPFDKGVCFDYHPTSKEVLWKDYLQAEGVVIKSEDYNKELNTGWSFKVKNMSYQEHQLSELHNIAKNILEKK